MAGIDYSQPILGAGASTKTDFAAAQARTGLNFTGNARFKRGIKAELGIEAFANASAGLSKFVHASIEGTAFARAKAGIQFQLPLNLFDEFGFAARAEAIAEAAAGVEVDLGLSIGEFIALAQRDQNLTGLPLELLLLLLEEVSIGGSFEVNVSVSAKAHASITVAGTIIEKAGQKAGFYFTRDAGAGLLFGTGMGFKVGIEFKDFRRFYGRAVDKSVDSTIQEIINRLPSTLKFLSNSDDFNPWFEVFSPISKIALRIGYDLGLKISANNPGSSKKDMAILCDEAIKIFLEEAQRFIFNKLLEYGIDSIRKLLEQEIPNLAQGLWDSAIQERSDLAAQLLAIPSEPFQDTAENLTYWQNLITKAIGLITKLGNPDQRLSEAISIIYCTTELLCEAVRSKINVTSSYTTVIGIGTVTNDTQPFKGILVNQPPAIVRNSILTAIGANPQNLTYADLLEFLVDDTIINRALASFPELKNFINIFTSDFNNLEDEILKLFLQNTNSFDPTNPNSAEADPHPLLTLIVQSIDNFLTNKFKIEILPQILNNISDGNLRLYIQEVLYPAVVYIKDVGLKSILNWDDPQRSFENDDFTESLAGVLMLLLGRTIVIVADTFSTKIEEGIEVSCKDVANKIRNGNNEIKALNLPVDPDILELVADCVEIGGEILGPLPSDTRGRIRNILYQIFKPISAGQEQAFLESLADEFFIPNANQLQQLTNELAKIAKDRFGLFVEKLVLNIGKRILEKLEELILAIVDLVIHWEKHLADALVAIAQFLRDLDQIMFRLNQELINLFEAATSALHNLFQTLGSSNLLDRIRNDIKAHFVSEAFNALENVDLYKTLPSDWREGIRNLVYGTVDVLLDNPLINPIFAAIAALSNQLDELLPDARELNPNDNIPEQIMLLIVDKIESNIRNHYGGTTQIPILPTIHFGYPFLVIDSIIPPQAHWDTFYLDIPLGELKIDIEPLLNLVRNSISTLDFYHDILNDACIKLGNALAKELEYAANKLDGEEKKSDQDRLTIIDQEHNNNPKEIAILNPLSLSHSTSAINVRIHFGGVTMSYLGLDKDEMQRVFIYINGQLIPNKSLVAGASLGDEDEGVHLRDYDYRNLIRVDSKTGTVKNSFNPKTGIITGSTARIVTDTSIHYPTQTRNQLINTVSTYSFSSSELKEQSPSKSTYMSPSKDKGVNPYLQKNISSDKKGRLISSYSIANNLPGRGNSASKMDNLLKERIPGILVQFKVELNEPFITEGVNVLTAVVIERGGNRLQQNVSFTVARPPKRVKPNFGGIELADKNGKEIQNVPLTFNRIFREYVEDNKMPERIKKSFSEIIKVDGSQIGPRKPSAITMNSIVNKSIQKRETITVVDEKGLDKKIILKYSSSDERTKKIKRLGLDNKQLLKTNKKISTQSIEYEEDLVVFNKSGKIIKRITEHYSPSDSRTKKFKKIKSDLKKKGTGGIIIQPAVQEQVEMKVKSILPVNRVQLNSRNELSLKYLTEQSKLNFLK